MIKILLLLPSLLFAAGGAGSPMDLLPNFVNITILFALLVWKLKGPISEHFKALSKNVSDVMTRAEVQAKEAQKMMDIHGKKMSESDTEINRLKADAAEEIKIFETDYLKDVDHRIIGLKEDAAQKIEAEKKSLSDSVNDLLVTNVIAKSKTTIKSSEELSKLSTQKVLKGL